MLRSLSTKSARPLVLSLHIRFAYQVDPRRIQAKSRHYTEQKLSTYKERAFSYYTPSFAPPSVLLTPWHWTADSVWRSGSLRTPVFCVTSPLTAAYSTQGKGYSVQFRFYLHCVKRERERDLSLFCVTIVPHNLCRMRTGYIKQAHKKGHKYRVSFDIGLGLQPWLCAFFFLLYNSFGISPLEQSYNGAVYTQSWRAEWPKRHVMNPKIPLFKIPYHFSALVQFRTRRTRVRFTGGKTRPLHERWHADKVQNKLNHGFALTKWGAWEVVVRFLFTATDYRSARRPACCCFNIDLQRVILTRCVTLPKSADPSRSFTLATQQPLCTSGTCLDYVNRRDMLSARRFILGKRSSTS